MSCGYWYGGVPNPHAGGSPGVDYTGHSQGYAQMQARTTHRAHTCTTHARHARMPCTHAQPHARHVLSESAIERDHSCIEGECVGHEVDWPGLTTNHPACVSAVQCSSDVRAHARASAHASACMCAVQCVRAWSGVRAVHACKYVQCCACVRACVPNVFACCVCCLRAR